MNKKADLLIILSPGFPANENDSVCLPFPQLFVKILKETYPQVKIVVMALQYPFEKKTYQWNGVPVFAYNGKNRGGFARLQIWQNVLWQVRRLLTVHRPIGVLGLWLGECSLLARYISKRYQVPYFSWLLGQDARNGNRYFKWINPAPGNLVALS